MPPKIETRRSWNGSIMDPPNMQPHYEGSARPPSYQHFSRHCLYFVPEPSNQCKNKNPFPSLMVNQSLSPCLRDHFKRFEASNLIFYIRTQMNLFINNIKINTHSYSSKIPDHLNKGSRLNKSRLKA